MILTKFTLIEHDVIEKSQSASKQQQERRAREKNEENKAMKK